MLASCIAFFYRPEDDLMYQITPLLINFKLITELEPKNKEPFVKFFPTLEANFDSWIEYYSLL